MAINADDEIFVSFVYWPIMRKYDSSYELQWEKEIDLKAVSKKVKTKVLQEECLRLYEQNPEIDFFEKHDYHKENLYEKVNVIFFFPPPSLLY